jgi:two-component system phosphate regulon response regulator PhoB
MAAMAGKNIILVEDDESLARLISHCLQRAGFLVEHINDGRKALQLVSRNELPAVIIVDYLMPYANGLKVISRLRGDTLWQIVPIICITDIISEDTMISGLRMRSDGFLTKPVKPEELIKLVTRLADRKSAFD